MLRGGLTERSVKNQKHSQTQFNCTEKLINGPDASQMGLLLAYLCNFLMSLTKRVHSIRGKGAQPQSSNNSQSAKSPELARTESMFLELLT